MADLGTPTYWAEYHARLLRQISDAAAAGLKLGFQLQPAPHSCEVAKARSDTVVQRDTLRPLPLPGCSKAPNCPCVYSPVIEP